ncbi:MAG: MBL fold metallo-hydrolase [Candidatus Woesearchaeota archaeon]
MRSQLVFLGTAGNLGVVSKQSRTSGGFIIKTGELQLHIDPGPGALTNAALCGINVRAHTAILISHAHLNHCNDLNALINTMTLNGLDSHGVLVAPESIINGTEHIKPVLHTHFANQLEKIIVAQPNKKIGIESIEVHPLAAKHSDLHSLGFKIFTPEFVLAYTGDTNYNPEIAKQYAGADIIVVNCQHPGKTKESGLCTADVTRLLKKAMPKLCILTHFSQRMLDANPLYEAREIQRQSGVQVIAAEDGMTLDPSSYSAEMKQKTLGLFTRGTEDHTR